MITYSVECHARRVNVVSYLSRMDFQRKLDPIFLEDVKNRAPAFGKQIETCFNVIRSQWWEGVNQMPNGRTSKTVHHRHAEALGSYRALFHLLNRPRSLLLMLALQLCRHPSIRTRIVYIQHHLADNMSADGPALQVVVSKYGLVLITIGRALTGFVDIEMVAPTGQF